MKKITAQTPAESLWNIEGNFNTLAGGIVYRNSAVAAEREVYTVSRNYEKHQLGVISLQDCFMNTSQESLCIHQFLSKFIFDDGEYQVYTQYNGWQKESVGQWQPLMTSVVAESCKMRFCDGAAPFLALWNEQTGRGTAFHLMADGAWQMQAKRVYFMGETSRIEVEIGLNSRGLSLEAAPGEKISFPEIIYYEFKNKRDMDCYKLHHYCNTRFPKWRMPVIYNTWLYKFDTITFENVMNQVAPAAQMGVEYFVIDAGWFGNSTSIDWGAARGDWKESLVYGFQGRMHEVSEAVRAAGMKFGIWLEPEIASSEAEVLKTHGHLYIKEDNAYFLDFSKQEAVDYIYDITDRLIARYQVSFIKIDFNASMKRDLKHCAFQAFYKGYNQYLKRLKAKYPELYLSACASGGLQSNLSICAHYDGIWISDNQSVYDSLRIFKDSILRLPPQIMEKWTSVTSYSGFTYAERYSTPEKILSTDDATWGRLIGVKDDFLRGFMQGSTVGVSCDLQALSEETFCKMQDSIRIFKEERSFWQNAVCRILTDTQSMLVLEYSDISFDKVKLLFFSSRIHQDNIKVYPVLSEKEMYRLSGEKEILK